MPYQLTWLIFLLPLASFAVIALFLRPLLKSKPKVAGYVTIGALAAALALSVWVLATVLSSPSRELLVPDVNLAVIGSVNIHVGLIIDPLTAVMLIVVTVVSLMVQIYSQGYMHGDPGYHRYYAVMSLFTASMLALVMADNLLFLYAFWEMVGLCSYLLIGFWFHKPAAANAAKKAFIVTRLGDFGFLVAILLLYRSTGTFDIIGLQNLAVTGAIAGTTLTWAAIGIFAGAAGKSAQFPLHVWLPDAMEGPTPVSALIHAATMVAAGVFLVARMFPLFDAAPAALNTVAIVGGFTAIFAATIGLVMTDIKRVLAYSTISQLGYMMLGLGVGGVAVGIFHLFTHAFFKALLFLGSGSVNHATGTFDMRLMGGLRKAMPWTCATFVIGSLSLAGIWPLAGFWSKDEILIKSLESNTVLWVLAMITVFLTAFYMFRAVFMTFGGEYRGGAPEAHGGHPHESPKVMVIPLVVLAVLAVVAGVWNITGHFVSFLGEGETHGFMEGFFGMFTHIQTWLSLGLAGLGIFLAWVIYSKRWLSPIRIGAAFRPVYSLLAHKYWLDELYQDVIVKNFLYRGLFNIFQLIDKYIIDGLVNGLAALVKGIGLGLRRWNTGQLQFYGLFFVIGVIVIVVCIFVF